MFQFSRLGAVDIFVRNDEVAGSIPVTSTSFNQLPAYLKHSLSQLAQTTTE